MKSSVSLRLSPVILTVVILLTLLFSPMVVQAAVSIQVIGGRSPQLADSPEGAQGGVSSGETVTIRAAEELVPMYDPAINHYRFAGWDTYPSGGAEIYDLADRKAMVTSFTANTDVTYMATFDVILKPGKPTITSAVGEKQSIHITFEPHADSGYPAPHQFRIFGDFGSYNVAGSERAFRIPNLKDEHTYQVFVEAIYDGVSGPSETVSITAGVMMFTIDFDSNGGTPVASQKVALGDLASPPSSDPVREGHTFEGWFWTNSGTNQKFTFDLPIYANLTLKAEWKKVEVPPHPTPAPTPTPSPTPEPTPEPSETDPTETTIEGISISFDTAGGDSIPDISVDASGELTLPPDPVREGYTFLGWYENGHRFDPLKPLVDDFTLVATWERAYPEDDLAYLIGEPGQLDGVLAKAIGVSGTYDPDTYRAELVTPFPSIRLVSVNDAEYHVTFHSLPH
ncbi:MAG TPA: hypothetical protein GXZ89_03055, partial [Fastidiosipila sp.]|nr:hypothetical protein [Fastidiosipila sp.]